MSRNASIGDFHICKEAADQFYSVAKKLIDDNDYMANAFYTYPVCVAFACELYMKAIMIYRSTTNEFLKGHNLRELFDYLNCNDAQVIANNFANKCSSKTIYEFLDENKNVFCDWRYALEGSVKINLSEFETLSNVLKEYVNKMEEENA